MPFICWKHLLLSPIHGFLEQSSSSCEQPAPFPLFVVQQDILGTKHVCMSGVLLSNPHIISWTLPLAPGLGKKNSRLCMVGMPEESHTLLL